MGPLLRMLRRKPHERAGFELYGAGAYKPILGRAGQAYLTIDL